MLRHSTVAPAKLPRCGPIAGTTSSLPPATAELLHPANRQRLLGYKRARSVSLGPCMRLLFENQLTLQYHVQQVARAERITDPAALAQEFDACAHLLPDGDSWRATLMLEVPDAVERRRELPLLNDAAHQLYVELPRLSRVRAQANEDQPDRHRSRLSAVHFLRFALPEPMRRALAQGAGIALGCEHPRYAWRRLMPAHTLALLCTDLAPLAP